MEKLIGKELKSLNNMLRRFYCVSDVIKECDNCTGMHGFLLVYLFEESEHRDVFQRDLEDAFVMRRSTASELLKLMEKNGLIVRESVPYDARLKKIVLTDKASALREALDTQFAKGDEIMKRGISQKDLNTFYEVVQKIRGNISENLLAQ